MRSKSLHSKIFSTAVVSGVLLLSCIGMASGQHGNETESLFKTNVDAAGAIKLPKRFATEWCHIGSVAAGDDIHNTYTTKDSLDYFRKNHKWKDGSILVKEVRKTHNGQLTTGDAHWEGAVKIWFVMMKDSQNRFPGNPLWGDGWGWSLYNGDNQEKQVAKGYQQNCLQCHIPAKSTDWVYSDKYPLLADDPISGSSDNGMSESMPRTSSSAGASNQASQSSEVDRGKKVFLSCANCHSIEAGKEGVGPSLFGVLNRKAGSEPAFDYSPALKKSGVVWTADNLSKHLADVPGFIPGNYMASEYPRGVKDSQDRAAVIEYLQTLH